MSMAQPGVYRTGPPSLALHPKPVHTGSADQEGQLAAALVRLSGQAHDRMVGSWFLEAGFGPCTTETRPFPESGA